ncbi:hypothetical protein MICAE_2450033 [Microcystis aeruginosa PCC 9806]|uniref:Uncharacterized protein n=1 Tax=Microcystis aeruginosa PCC 9806 TaxID=1160282 RepID=I4GWW7_MICAE|nr:hypothetical protein MICAE_2450033 [Microcystis aeruginosa PCC 9806]
MGCGVWGETIHNLRVNHTIKKGFGMTLKLVQKYEQSLVSISQLT